jgi:hypothetical protein
VSGCSQNERDGEAHAAIGFANPQVGAGIEADDGVAVEECRRPACYRVANAEPVLLRGVCTTLGKPFQAIEADQYRLRLVLCDAHRLGWVMNTRPGEGSESSFPNSLHLDCLPAIDLFEHCQKEASTRRVKRYPSRERTGQLYNEASSSGAMLFDVVIKQG